MAGRKQRVTDDDYIKVALDFLGTHDQDQLTTRALGQALGVDATAIYRHFPSLDDLLTAVRDHVHKDILDKVEANADAVSPRERIKQIVAATRSVYAEHPQLSQLHIRGHGRLANGLELSRRVMQALGDMGLAGTALAVAYQMVESTTIGMTIFDNSSSPRHLAMRQDRYRAIGGALGEAANSTATVAEINDRAFDNVIEAVLDECEKMASR